MKVEPWHSEDYIERLHAEIASLHKIRRKAANLMRCMTEYAPGLFPEQVEAVREAIMEAREVEA